MNMARIGLNEKMPGLYVLFTVLFVVSIAALIAGAVMWINALVTVFSFTTGLTLGPLLVEAFTNLMIEASNEDKKTWLP